VTDPARESVPTTRAAGSAAIPCPECLPKGRIEAGSYRLRFARTASDIDRLLALRFEVFNLELGEGLEESFATGRDTDRFDGSCHHMLVEEENGELIGTYRMQTAAMAAGGHGFYSAGEYDLDTLPEGVLDKSVEIGRACIHRDHRKRAVLFLLWKGLARYVVHNRCRYLFGCCSLTSQDQAAGIRLYRQLKAAGKVVTDVDVPPLPHTRCEAPDDQVAALPDIEVPPLFATYLRYGALVCSRPAIDRDFKTIDYLVLMDTAALSRRTRLIFGLEDAPPASH
jgi:putative hemolysin